MLKKYLEKNIHVKRLEIISLVLLLLITSFLYLYGIIKINHQVNNYEYLNEVILNRQFDYEDYDEDSTVCDVLYTKNNDELIVKYQYEEYIDLKNDEIKAYKYLLDDDTTICLTNDNPNLNEINIAYKSLMANKMMTVFNIANALLILSLSVALILLFGSMFSSYEKIWFISIMFLATIIGIIFPEESANGVNGIYIMLLYLLDTFFNILCELLISKQSRYNFIVSLLVEITEIIITLILMYRFATMVVTLLFWIPIDILSFINWSHHKDEDEEIITKVRRLKGYQELLIILLIIIWTIVVGYFISGLNIKTDFINQDVAIIIAYIDACASAVGIANGLFIFFRLSEQWIAWYICALLESIINIMTGQYVLLVLKLGYFTNTTYGLIKWNKYIKNKQSIDKTLF